MNKQQTSEHIDASERVTALERRLRHTQLMLTGVIAIGIAASLVGFAQPQDDANEVIPEIRTNKLVVVDDQGVPRVQIGQDPVNTQRRSRSAGITIFDNKGHERGGMATFDDGSVVLALDAPRGVGAPMPDRIGMHVYPDGSSHIMLLDNETRAVAKLYSDGKGGGGPQVFKWDEKSVQIKTIEFDGEDVQTIELGG